MKLSKKFICIIAIALVVAAALCWLLPIAIYGGKVVISNENYVVTEKDGMLALEFSSKYEQLNNPSTGIEIPGMNISVAAPYVNFTNFEELKSNIKNGDFTEEELKEIARFTRNKDGKVILPDINSIYTPVFPSEFRLKLSFVEWSKYGFIPFYTFDAIGNTDVYSACISQENFNKEIETVFANPDKRLEDNGAEILKVSAGKYENSTLVSYKAYTGYICEALFYTITEEGKTMYVEEIYDQGGKGYPAILKIYVKQDDQYFSINMNNCKFQPKYEQISQIYFEKV